MTTISCRNNKGAAAGGERFPLRSLPEGAVMKTIHLDIETFSSVDLKKCGLYRYTESPDFEVLLFGYAVDSGAVQVVDLACGETIPADILEALTDDTVTKLAHNSAFERICLSRYLRDMGVSLDPFADNHHSAAVLGKAKYLNPESWRCTMVWAAYMGLPLSLEGVGAVLGLEKQKLTEGKDLIRYFCKPCVPTIKNGGRTRNLPEHDPEKWAAFKEYNIRDVEVEMAIEEKLKKFPVPDEEWDNFILDQQINDRGILLDMTLVHRAIEADALSRRQLSEKIGELTSIENSNSVAQMKTWLADNGLEMDSLGKKEIAEALQTAPPALAEVLRLRQSLAKSSVKKYQAMQNCVCADHRARGLIQFYGANRTGRFAGRLIQVQNLPQNHLEDLEQARNLVKLGDFDAVWLLYNSTQNVLSELIRTAFVPKPGCKFIVADFSAIEARVIAWLAGETWRNEVFSTHGKIYEASASQMFKVPIDSITKTSPLRQKGKIAELALGYGGSVGALKAMGALEMGLDETELQPLVNAWRAANPNIVKLWWDIDRAVKKTVTERVPTEVRGVKFARESGFLFITLPSGRKLAYVKPRIGENRFGGDCVTYEGVGGTKKWERIESYGPKFVENIVQAISRDILCYALRTFRCCEIVMHCHGEIVIEADKRMSLDVVCQQMSRTPPWAEGLLLRADGYECGFYQKK
jgi:DNA polymerase